MKFIGENSIEERKKLKFRQPIFSEEYIYIIGFDHRNMFNYLFFMLYQEVTDRKQFA